MQRKSKRSQLTFCGIANIRMVVRWNVLLNDVLSVLIFVEKFDYNLHICVSIGEDRSMIHQSFGLAAFQCWCHRFLFLLIFFEITFEIDLHVSFNFGIKNCKKFGILSRKSIFIIYTYQLLDLAHDRVNVPLMNSAVETCAQCGFLQI